MDPLEHGVKHLRSENKICWTCRKGAGSGICEGVGGITGISVEEEGGSVEEEGAGVMCHHFLLFSKPFLHHFNN